MGDATASNAADHVIGAGQAFHLGLWRAGLASECQRQTRLDAIALATKPPPLRDHASQSCRPRQTGACSGVGTEGCPS